MSADAARAVVLPGVDRPLELVHRAPAEPEAGEVRVRVQACGVCGSDLFLQHGGFGADRLPRVPGHEAAGIVDGLGPGVTGLRRGDQVALYYIDADPDGEWARAGRENLEPGLRRMGVDVDGAFADYVVRPARTLVPTPERIDPAVLAVLTDAVATPLHALEGVARIRPGERLAVIGVGGIGSNAVQLGKLLGATVVAVSRGRAKLDLALELGADAVVAGGAGTDVAAGVRDALDGHAPDVVLQCVGDPALDELAIALAGPGGRVVLVGASDEPFRTRSVDLIWRELSVMGSRGFTLSDIRRVIALHLEGRLRTDHLVKTRRPLEEANEAMDDLRAGRVLRSVLCPDPEALEPGR